MPAAGVAGPETITSQSFRAASLSSPPDSSSTLDHGPGPVTSLLTDANREVQGHNLPTMTKDDSTYEAETEGRPPYIHVCFSTSACFLARLLTALF